jgi:hypothetical protein
VWRGRGQGWWGAQSEGQESGPQFERRANSNVSAARSRAGHEEAATSQGRDRSRMSAEARRGQPTSPGNVRVGLATSPRSRAARLRWCGGRVVRDRAAGGSGGASRRSRRGGGGQWAAGSGGRGGPAPAEARRSLVGGAMGARRWRQPRSASGIRRWSSRRRPATFIAAADYRAGVGRGDSLARCGRGLWRGREGGSSNVARRGWRSTGQNVVPRLPRPL